MKFFCILSTLFTLIVFPSFYFKGENVITYPYPVKRFTLLIEQQNVKMAFMDIEPVKPNGQTVLLLHGKNFNGYYWKTTIEFLSGKGYRVIVPDQVGWGKSDRPDIHYSFHLLASNTYQLLNHLNIENVIVVGHSMGGMVGVRFALMYPSMVDKLILENPIGLEDYKTFVPYDNIDRLYEAELNTTYQSLLAYHKTYYPAWKEEYEELVKVQAADLQSEDFKQTAWVNALTYQMIYEQPVCYEFNRVAVPTLLVIGQEDRTIVGKNKLSDDAKHQHGNYPELGKKTQAQIPESKLVELDRIGHIPHIQSPGEFHKHIQEFIKNN